MSMVRVSIRLPKTLLERIECWSNQNETDESLRGNVSHFFRCAAESRLGAPNEDFPESPDDIATRA